MFDDGWLKAGAFANLSTNADFDKFFESGFSFRIAQSSGINYDRCKTASVKQKEMLLGGRGVWWTRYANLVTPAGAIEPTQVGGYQGTTRFGDRLAEASGKQSAPAPPAGPAPQSTASSSARSHNVLRISTARPALSKGY